MSSPYQANSDNVQKVCQQQKIKTEVLYSSILTIYNSYSYAFICNLNLEKSEMSYFNTALFFFNIT